MFLFNLVWLWYAYIFFNSSQNLKIKLCLYISFVGLDVEGCTKKIFFVSFWYVFALLSLYTSSEFMLLDLCILPNIKFFMLFFKVTKRIVIILDIVIFIEGSSRVGFEGCGIKG